MNLASQHVKRGDEVLSISRSPMRGPAYTYGLESQSAFRYAQAHLVTQLPSIMVLLDTFRPEVIVNFAAQGEVGQSWNHPVDYYQTNAVALVKLTEELKTRDYMRVFVQVASSEVYGSVEAPANEDTPYRPSSPYAASKAVFDWHLRAIAKQRAFPALLAMPSNGYCMGQTMNRIIPRTIVCALNGTKLQLQGGGVARKSYLHGDDISAGIMLVAEKGFWGETYHMGPEKSISIRELVQWTARWMGKSLPDVAELAPERTGQDAQYLLDSTKLRALGWQPTITLDEGLPQMIDWVKRYPELLKEDPTYTHRP